MPDQRRLLASVTARLQRAGGRGLGLARDMGLLPYRPEQWTGRQWHDAYRSGQLDYFGDVRELARYSILAGYLTSLGGHPRVLDVGCGTGRFLDHLRGVAYGSYLGIDIAATAIDDAGTRIDDRTAFRVGGIDVVDATFDVVVLNEVLYFASDPDAMLRRVDHLLEPAGSVLTSMWRHPGDRALWRRVDHRFDVVDRVDVKNPANSLARAGWRIAWHRKHVSPES